MPECVTFSEALNALIDGKKAKLVSMPDDEHVEMGTENDEPSLFLQSKRNGRKHYRPSNKALFSSDWIVFE